MVGKPVVLKAMDGFNGTVFTYGQTGSGKTWTMRGCDSDPGMMILCIRDIFSYVEDHKENKYILKVSYLEVYNEEINDLLNPDDSTSKNLKITAEDAARGRSYSKIEYIKDLRVIFSILVVSHFMWNGASDSSDLLLSYPLISLSSPMTNILITILF